MGDVWFVNHLVQDLYPEYIKNSGETSQAVQWLGFQASTAGGVDLILVLRTKIPHDVRCGWKREEQNKTYEELL